MKNKLKLLCWSDHSLAGTGFGVVSRHVLSALHKTGRYEIHHLAINYKGEFVDENKVPWQVQSAKQLDPMDPHGVKMFVKSISQIQYDIVWVMNDLFVTQHVAEVVEKAKDKVRASGKKVPKFIYYYPVDCIMWKEASEMVRVADFPVCYTDYGRKETLSVFPEVENRLEQIGHGVDSKTFSPANKKQINIWKKSIFGLDPDQFLVVSVNRNSVRKQIPYSLLVLKEFKKKHPNAVMYVHTVPRDQGGDIVRAMNHLGLSHVKDVILPTDYDPGKPVPDHVLNAIYNMGDLFLTTHLGEGWGLTPHEAMACGVPVVAPYNTNMPEMFGQNSERGYLYPCKDTIWVDNSGYRPKGLIEDIVSKMEQVLQDGPKDKNPKVKLAREWAVENNWEKITKKWVSLFKKVENTKQDESVMVETI